MEFQPSAVSHTALVQPDFLLRRKQALAFNRGLHGEIDALIIADLTDILYLTGVGHGISWLVVMDGSTFAVSRHMLINEVREASVDCDILLAADRSVERPDLEQFIFSQLSKRGVTRVAVDPARLTALSYLKLARHSTTCGMRLQDAPELLAGIRAIKDPYELNLSRQCVSIAERALNGLLAQGAAGLIGRSERDLAIELESRMISLGADRQGFPETGIIVASGPNSASAHHTPGHRKVAEGEALLIDWGAELAGYRSDLTRTVFLRSVPEFAIQAYPVVEQALHRAAGLVRHGAAMGEIDQAARDTVMDAGYTEFHYGVGHGVGLAVHEAPWLRADSAHYCEADMLTTIEPGIYLHGTGGIRIENLYRITRQGSECLGQLPTDLASMVLR